MTKDLSGEFVYSKYLMPNISHQSQAPLIKPLGELVLMDKFPNYGGHFVPYNNFRGMVFKFYFNNCPDGMFSCEIWDREDNQSTKKEIHWNGPQFQFRSLKHIKPFCIWLTDLNLQNLDVDDIKSLAHVKLNVNVVCKDMYLNIIEQAYNSFRKTHNNLTIKTREQILNWFCEQLRRYPISHESDPAIIKTLKHIIEATT